MRVLSCKVTRNIADKFDELATKGGESMASMLRKWVETYVSRHIDKPAVETGKVDSQNSEIEGRPTIEVPTRERHELMVNAYQEEIKTPEVDPEKLKKFKEKWGR